MLTACAEAPMAKRRLRVALPSAEVALRLYAQSQAHGGCVVTAAQPLAPGARLRLELVTASATLAIEGVVIAVTSGAHGHDLAIACSPIPDDHDAVERLLSQLAADPQYAVARATPRVPVDLFAFTSTGTPLIVRNLSRGGMLLETVQFDPPVEVGAAVALRLARGGHVHVIDGHVVWHAAEPGRDRVGVAFGALSDDAAAALDALLHLQRPERLEVAIG